MHHLRRLALACAATLACSSAASAPARAQAGAPAVGVDDAKAAAQQLLAAGNQALGDGDYLVALDRYRAAYARFPSPKLLLNIGTALRQLGRSVEAAQAYEDYLRAPDADPSRTADLRRILGELESVVGRLRVEVSGPWDAIRLDGKRIEGFQSGQSLRVQPGEHTLVADRAGVPPAVQTVTVAAQQELRVTLSFTPRAPERAPAGAGVQRKLAFAFGGLGLLGLTAGAIAAGVARAKDTAASRRCLSPSACDQEGVDLGNAALASGTAATVAFAAGAGALGTGVVLFFTAPAIRSRPTPGIAGLTVGLGGVF